MLENKNQSGEKKLVFLKRRDIIIIAAILLLALIVFVATSLNAKSGAIAKLTIITSEGQNVYDIPLSEDKIHSFDDGALLVVLEVKDGRIRFINSVCPDHDCEGFGWLRYEGDWAACLPAGASVRIVEPL